MTNIITRESGWGPIAKSEIPKLYDEAMRRSSKLAVSSVLESAEKIKYPTLAERFGAYVRDLFAVYKALHEAMKTGHHWVALSVHSTMHSSADFDDAVLIGQNPAEDQVQVRGRSFDPLVFDFVWRDNTMDPSSWFLVLLKLEAHPFIWIKPGFSTISSCGKICLRRESQQHEGLAS